MTFSFGGIGSHSRSDKKIIKESVIHLYVHVCVCVCVCVWVKGQATCRTPKTIWETRINICHMHLAEMYVGNKRKYLSVIDQLRSVSNCWPLIGWWMEVQQIYRQFYGYMVERSVQDMNSWIWYGWFWWSIEYIYIEHVYTYLYLIRGGMCQLVWPKYLSMDIRFQYCAMFIEMIIVAYIAKAKKCV